MFAIFLYFLVFIMALLVLKVIFEKDNYTKILFINTSTSVMALFICFLGSMKYYDSYLDIALIYFIIGSIGTSVFARYFLTKQDEEA